MNCKELCERHNLPVPVIYELESMGLLNKMNIPVEEKDYTEMDVQFINRILTLKNAGIELQTIGEIIRLEADGDETAPKRLKILTEQRSKQMSQLHLYQKMIDRLDFLIGELKVNNKILT